MAQQDSKKDAEDDHSMFAYRLAVATERDDADKTRAFILNRLLAVTLCGSLLVVLLLSLGYVGAAAAVLVGGLWLAGVTALAPRLGYNGRQMRMSLAAADAAAVGGLAVVAGSFMVVFLIVVLVELTRVESTRRSILTTAGLAGLIAIMLAVLALINPDGLPLVSYSNQQMPLLAASVGALALAGLLLVDLGSQHQRVIANYEYEYATNAAEMKVAHEIQKKLLAPPEWHSGEWTVAALSIPAREVGGDFYEYIPAQGNSLGGIAVGDVSGKGMPAALLMAVVRTVFRIEARRRIFPAETLKHLNSSLRTEMPEGMTTLLYAYIDPVGRWLHFANAGHNYPVVMVNGRVAELALSGLPLGISDDVDYQERSVRLPPGCSVLFYTDGVVEATNASGELFGFERLLALLASVGPMPARELVTYLAAEVAKFSGVATQSDDITLIVLQHTIPSEPNH